MECEICKASFKTISSLNKHKKNAKYCMKIKENYLSEKEKCEYCGKYMLKKSLKPHYSVCKIFLHDKNNEYIIKVLEEKNKEDSARFKKLAEQPKTQNINNTKILNISSLQLDKEKIKQVLDDKFDMNYICDGQKGLANFTLNNFLKDDKGELTYICTDPSRQIFKYKDSLGDIQKDVKAKKLTNILMESGIKDTVQRVSIDSWTNNDGSQDTEKFMNLVTPSSEISSLHKDNSVFVNELSTIAIQ
jgi:hypothetical protein